MTDVKRPGVRGSNALACGKGDLRQFANGAGIRYEIGINMREHELLRQLGIRREAAADTDPLCMKINMIQGGQ